MTEKKSIIVRTSLSVGIFMFLILLLIPSLSLLYPVNKNYEIVAEKIHYGYKNMGIPDIHYNNQEIRANDDLVFKKAFNSNSGKGEFFFAIDTSENPDKSLTEWIRRGAGGGVFYREKAVFYTTRQKRENSINFSDIPFNGNITINSEFFGTILSKFKSPLIIILISLKFFGHFFGKIILFGIVALVYSSKAKLCGGGNYSLALWSLVPPTIFQSLMSIFPAFTCCSFIIYYVIWVFSFITMEKKLVPVKVEEV